MRKQRCKDWNDMQVEMWSFLDDLQEILLDDNFTKNTKKYLFDPKSNYININGENLECIQSWKVFSDLMKRDAIN